MEDTTTVPGPYPLQDGFPTPAPDDAEAPAEPEDAPPAPGSDY